MSNLLSLPGPTPTTSAIRKASAPNWSMTSSGSTPLSSDLLNLLPWLSRTIPCKYTVSNGISPSKKVLIKIMRATQKNKISYPGAITWVGWNSFRSAVSSGQPSVENVHRAEENQVSSVSSNSFQSSEGGLSPTCTSMSP